MVLYQQMKLKLWQKQNQQGVFQQKLSLEKGRKEVLKKHITNTVLVLRNMLDKEGFN